MWWGERKREGEREEGRERKRERKEGEGEGRKTRDSRVGIRLGLRVFSLNRITSFAYSR